MCFRSIALIIGAGLTSTFFGCSSEKSVSTEIYQPEWSSLARHQTPNWLNDMKFGIYSHWGPQSAAGEQLNTDNVEAAFADWTGEKFDANKWAQLFKDAGAQFAGPVAIHGTGCVNWNSEITDFNSTNYGPKVDILGELTKAVRARGMKTLATFHNTTKKGVWGQRSREDKTYIQPTYDNSEQRSDMRWLEGWYERVSEAATKYDLDIVWFDTSFGGTVGAELSGFVKGGKYIPNAPGKQKSNQLGGVNEKYQKKLIATYYSDAAKKGREVEVVYKTNDIPVNIGMRDMENGTLEDLQYDPWMADINIMHHSANWSWFYSPKNKLKDANCIVDMLVDITSKNGRMLLNVPPYADGSFPEVLVNELKQIGAWLKINGEGIYGTNPWSMYGEGPTSITKEGHHGQGIAGVNKMEKFTGKDYRYTTKGNAIYAFVLDVPENGTAKFASLGSDRKLYPNDIVSVTMLGSNEKIEYSHEPDGLVVKFPKKLPCDFAYCFKICVK